ncbi:MAG TPA: YegP family protein [Flavobacteriales bacterium]|nr:YegP family protein [Flavobacteriales bacterium]
MQKSSRGQFYYTLLANNHEVVLHGEEHPSKQACQGSIDAVKRNAALDERYTRWETSGKYHFNLKAGNGEILGTGEAYNSIAARENGIEVVKREAPGAGVEDRS